MEVSDNRVFSRNQYDKKRMWKEDIRTAKELGYPTTVIKMLENEPDWNKRQHILCNARTGKYNKRKH